MTDDEREKILRQAVAEANYYINLYLPSKEAIDRLVSAINEMRREV